MTQEDFNKGNVAFMPLTFAEYRTYKTYPYRIKKYTKFQWDCITFPAGKEGKTVPEWIPFSWESTAIQSMKSWRGSF